MNKHVFALTLVLVLSVTPLFADLGEDFAKGGIGLAGSLSLYNNYYYFQDPAEQRKFWSLDVSPTIDYYVADRLALRLSPYFHYESFTTDPNNIDRYEAYGVRLGLDYAVVMDPAAKQGLVLTVGGLIGFALYPTVNDLVGGVETPNNFQMTNLLFTITPRLYYFLNDRLAPYIGITPQFAYVVSYSDPSGATVNLTSQQRLRADVTLTRGIAFFIPNKDATMFRSE